MLYRRNKNRESNDLRNILQRNEKPIIILKGGRSKTGSIAAKSHTASIREMIKSGIPFLNNIT